MSRSIKCFPLLLIATFIQSSLSYPTFANPDSHLGHLSGFPSLHDHGSSSLLTNEYQGGVGIVGGGGPAKGITIDLTKESGGGGHTGLFGGSFVASGEHFQGAGAAASHLGHAGLASYGSPLSSYDVGLHHTSALSPVSEDHGSSHHEVSPVLYSNFNHGQHFPLHASGLHSGAAFGAPEHFGGGLHFNNEHHYSH